MLRSNRSGDSPRMTMARTRTAHDDLERFRAYLGLLARLEVSGAMRDKVDLSGVVQQTLLEAHQALQGEPAQGRTEAHLSGSMRSILSHNMADLLRTPAARTRDVR